MGFKRPFADGEIMEISFKQLRQMEYSNQMTSFSGIDPCKNYPLKPDVSVDIKDFIKDTAIDVSNVDYKDSTLLSSSTSEEDFDFEAKFPLLFSPHHFESSPSRGILHSDDTHSFFENYSPRIQVSVGPDHQAILPVWDPHVIDVGLGLIGDNNHFQGTCVIPMPDPRPPVHNRKDCCCLDGDSIRCVRQHVSEAREEVRKDLGLTQFAELGLCEMGEEVARKWSEEDEHTFHEIVFSNPASLGKNFWAHLSYMFPSRTKMELVSYFYNVFMLRRRAAQNRSYSMHIDSDDDEWQASNGVSYEVRHGEEEDSSGVDQHEKSSPEDEDNGNDDVSETRIREMVDDERGSFWSGLDALGDDSCTSFEREANMVGPFGSGGENEDRAPGVDKSGERVGCGKFWDDLGIVG